MWDLGVVGVAGVLRAGERERAERVVVLILLAILFGNGIVDGLYNVSTRGLYRYAYCCPAVDYLQWRIRNI